MPYYIPFRHRQRTKSENADASNPPASQDSMDCENINDNVNENINDMEPPLHHVSSNPQFNKIKISQLKKSKSMESLLPPKSDDNESKSSSSTLEFVSSRIQKLKFNE